MPDAVEIACCFDRAYAVPAAVVAASVLARTSAGRRYVFHCIYDGPDDFPSRLFAGFSGTRLEVRPLKVRNLFTNVPTSYPGMPAVGFLRLALPELLIDVRKVISVDPDILCLTDIAPLFDTALGDCAVGAVRDVSMAASLAWEAEDGRAETEAGRRLYLRSRLGLDDAAAARYFNAGVLLLDLERLRQEGFGDEAKAFLKRPGEPLRWNEQCTFNALLANRYKGLEGRWNVMMDPPRLDTYRAGGVALMHHVAEAWADPAILHFNWRAKPWMRDRIPTPWATMWWAYALAAPVPLAAKLRRPIDRRELVKHWRMRVVRAMAARIRSHLR